MDLPVLINGDETNPIGRIDIYDKTILDYIVKGNGVGLSVEYKYDPITDLPEYLSISFVTLPSPKKDD